MTKKVKTPAVTKSVKYETESFSLERAGCSYEISHSSYDGEEYLFHNLTEEELTELHDILVEWKKEFGQA